MTNQNTPDGRLVAEQNQQAVLHWLHRFGGLTTRQLARLVWPGKAAGQRMAQRTIGRLERQGLVLQRVLFTGGKIYVLSEGGARLLRELGTPGVSARGHRDLSFRKPMHRMIANDFLIEIHNKIVQNDAQNSKIWTEFEIQRRLAPYPTVAIRKQLKIPDSMIQQGNNMAWIEVENAYKSPREIGRVIETAALFFENYHVYKFRHNGTDYSIDYFYLVIPTDLRLQATVKAIAKANLNLNTLEHVYVAKVKMTSGLVWQGIEYATMAANLIDKLEQP